MNALLYAGIACLVVTGILSGVFSTGVQQRGNYYSESKEDRASRRKVENWFFIAGIVLLAAAGVARLILR